METTPSTQNRLQTVHQWALRLALAAAFIFFLYNMVLALIPFVEHASAVYKYKYSMDYGEGPILDQVARLSRFENIYQPDLSQYPYTITNYPPVYPAVQTPFFWIFGPALWYGRAISLLSVLAAAVFIGLSVHTLTRNPLAGAAAGLALFAFPIVLHWAPLVRVDSLALGLSWAGLFVLVRWEKKRWGLIAAAALLAAAVSTRQSYGLAAPLAAFIYLLRPASAGGFGKAPLRKQPVFTFIAWLAGIGLGFFALMMIFSRGGFFTHIVTANVNLFRWETVQDYVNQIKDHFYILLIASSAVLLTAWLNRQGTWWLAAPYLIGATLSAITIGKAGSNVNYLYEFCAALSLGAGAALGWARGNFRWVTVLLLVAFAFQVQIMVDWSMEDHYMRNMRKLPYTAELFRLTDLVERTGGDILADEYMALLPLTGHRLTFQPFEFKMMVQEEVWDQEPFLEMIRQKEFSMILLYDPRFWDSRNERWTPEMLDAIEENYRREINLAETTVLKPRE